MSIMKILAIETSCDETAIAIIEASGDPKRGAVRFTVLSNVVLSQVKLHEKFGGVYPSLAKREHAKNLIPLLKKALTESNFLKLKNSLKPVPHNLRIVLDREPELLKHFLKFIPRVEKPPIDAIAVTYGPGLEPALWVGINFAKALGTAWNIPIIPVNHMEGHICSAFLEKTEKNSEFRISSFKFPVLALLISGGHTELVLMEKWLGYKMVGETHDDAAGEAFDKVARMLGLPYPGGPAISEQAHIWKSQFPIFNFKKKSKFLLPRPMLNSPDFNFSFSGLKTAVLYRLKEIKKLTPKLIREFSYEFQEAVTEVLVSKTIRAAEKYRAKTIIVGGGVSANKRIRDQLKNVVARKLPETTLFIPPQELTTDNALMIAVAGYLRNTLQPITHKQQHIKARGNLRFSA